MTRMTSNPWPPVLAMEQFARFGSGARDPPRPRATSPPPRHGPSAFIRRSHQEEWTHIYSQRCATPSPCLVRVLSSHQNARVFSGRLF
ncbi:hypothetical protein EJ06DRAFT_192085 [Trichodelitschia bisporula]|uniref:Uncharacterized protein n=1 Tax=Trichodelitschia bisporula TaxID=703511 RepID=A0A6G1I7F5_9PEZI|nr:hypothetical protein EJ06DRAFT_192085 [Trichodelitschia bisporula]